jgi:hypothetical protein
MTKQEIITETLNHARPLIDKDGEESKEEIKTRLLKLDLL